MQLTLLGTNLESPTTVSVADLNEVESIILNHDRPELFSAYYSENVEYLRLTAYDIYGSLSEKEDEILKEKYLNDADLRDHAGQLMRSGNYTEVFHELNEFTNVRSNPDCHPIERIIEAVADSSYHTGFDKKDFIRNLADQFGGLSEILKCFTEDEVETALENC